MLRLVNSNRSRLLKIASKLVAWLGGCHMKLFSSQNVVVSISYTYNSDIVLLC